MNVPLDPAIWRGRRVLLTGHTGFKGSWAALWLKHAGAEVTGLALPPQTRPALFELAGVARDIDHRVVDIRDRDAVARTVAECRPEIVLHLAAQAIVRRGVREPLETIATNVLGTAHLLDVLRRSSGVAATLIVTTDKVYENYGDGRSFVETDPLGGSDPYSASKAAAEIVTQAYAETYFRPSGIPVASARGGNVIGGGDFAEDRLVPDVWRATSNHETLVLRYPDSTRPWHHVLDCLAGYFRYVAALVRKQDVPHAMNFGPAGAAIPVRAVAEAMLAALGAPVSWRRDHTAGPREPILLSIDSSMTRSKLGWVDQLGGSEAIEWTAAWYRAHRRGDDMRAVTLAQIDAYERRFANPAVAADAALGRVH